jgi:hypothetical protein
MNTMPFARMFVASSLCFAFAATGCGEPSESEDTDQVSETTEEYTGQGAQSIAPWVFPQVAEIGCGMNANFAPYCSGILVGKKTVFSAGHCVQAVFCFGGPGNLPTIRVTNPVNQQSRTYQSTNKHVRSAMISPEDFGILNFNTEIANITPACLANKPSCPGGSCGSGFLVAGMRNEEDGGDLPIPNCATNDCTNASYDSGSITLLSNNLLEMTGLNAVTGDSGGPLFKTRTYEYFKMGVYGTLSHEDGIGFRYAPIFKNSTNHVWSQSRLNGDILTLCNW